MGKATSTASSQTASVLSVLLVEDEPELAELLKVELEAADFYVELAGNGREGLDCLRHSMPDLIVTDIMMPEMDGLEFIEALRADPLLCQIPVIILTTRRTIADIVEGLDAGADDYLTKPIDPAEFLARVHSKIGRPPVPAEQIWRDRHSGLLSARAFRYELGGEMLRAVRASYQLTVASIDFPERAQIRKWAGPGADGPLARQVSKALAAESGPLDLVGRSTSGGFLLMMPETTETAAARKLERISKFISGTTFAVNDNLVRLTPVIGYARSAPLTNADDLLEKLYAAQSYAESRRDLVPIRYEPGMRAVTRRRWRIPSRATCLEWIGFRARTVRSRLEPLVTGMAATRQPTPLTQTQSVLLVEDEPELAELLKIELESAGYYVDHANNGRSGLEYLTQFAPDLIVTDIMMPEMDGLEFMEALRADPVLTHIPAIVLTTKRKIEDIVKGFNVGADDYVVKPVNPTELLARVRGKIKRPPIPAQQLREDRQSGFLSPGAFQIELQSEILRASRVGYPLTAAVIGFAEKAIVRERIGPGADGPLARQVSEVLEAETRPLDLIGRSVDGDYLVMMPELGEEAAAQTLDRITERLVETTYHVRGESLRLTPTIGFARATPKTDADALIEMLRIAQLHAASHLDLRPARYELGMVAAPRPQRLPRSLSALLERARFPAQIAATFALGWLVPFVVYLAFSAIGSDISKLVYILVVIALVLTCILIWTEGYLALRRVDPPEDEQIKYPPASAIIAAYLPNEAATIISTLNAMLSVDYPGALQIILAYNTPKNLPIERVLREMAAKDPRLEVIRIAGSTSKAQNVNAAISYVKGEFTAVYDADHQPDPNSFKRAWQWINAGADIVQGHCLIRNGDASWVARMVAVEFEQIYTVSHPGRTRLHKFGIFGGSNGFWRTELLRRTRMRGSMLTEDIDSSLRVVEAGGSIVSDPLLVSRELSPTTFSGLTNQRLRWAQGWYQVSKIRFWSSMRSPKLSVRQKVGMFYLLVWRELFPWIAMQIVPIIAFWAYQAGSLGAIDWTVPLFLVITLFVLGTGPGQIYYTYRLADPEIRQNRRWFVFYVFIAIIMYAEYKNLLSRVANVKEWLKEKSWKITPRS